MPRKKTTSAEPEPAAESRAAKKAAPEGLVIEPMDDLPKPRRKTPVKAAAKEPAAKKRAVSPKARKTAKAGEPELAAAEAAAETPAPGNAEAAANVADTFEDAFEANDTGEARLSTAAPDGDEGDELEGDWESGSGDEKKEKPELPPGKQERLQKILAAAGVASRRHAEELIVAGRVEVNGQVVTTLGSKADAARDHIRVDGKLLHGAERLRYFVLNKPRGYVTTVSDPEGRPTVMEFFARMGERLYPVGRLDYLSEGLLLMTNDGELANKLTRAASGVEKVYLVKVAGQPDEAQIEALRSGVQIDRERSGEGKVQTSPARIRQFRQGENPWFEVGLIEGRNRELRKMFEEIGHHVEKIRRVGYGPLELDVEPGKMRELTPEEVQALRLAADGKLKPKRIRAGDKLPLEAGRTVGSETGKRRAERPASGQDRRPETSGAPRDSSKGRMEGGRPERKFEPRRGQDTGQGRAGAGRGFKPREERPARWQDRGPAGGQRPGPQQDLRPQRASTGERGRSEGESSGQRRPFQARPAFGGKPKPFGDKPRTYGDRPKPFGGKPPAFGDRPKTFGGKPQAFGDRPKTFGDRPKPFGDRPPRTERAGGEGQRFDRGGNRGFGRSAPPGGRPPFRGRPQQENQRPRTARPPRPENIEDRGARPPRFERSGQDRPSFKREPDRNFERPSRPPRSAEARPFRGGPGGGGERRPAAPRSGGFAKRGPGSGSKSGGQRFGARPGGASRTGRGKPPGGGGRKPGGFGKGRPR